MFKINQVSPESNYPQDAWKFLSNHLTEQRKNLLEKTASLRTDQLRIVLQDVNNPHNVSACLRSAEAFGLYQVEVVSLNTSYKPSSVARGVAKWLNIRTHSSIDSCVRALRQDGFKLAAALPSPEAHAVSDLEIDQPLALVFGNEHRGLDKPWYEHLDLLFTIPMYGMVESLNISVAAAISIEQLSAKLRNRPDTANSSLISKQQQNMLLAQWVCQHFPNWGDLYKKSKKEV